MARHVPSSHLGPVRIKRAWESDYQWRACCGLWDESRGCGNREKDLCDSDAITECVSFISGSGTALRVDVILDPESLERLW